MASILASYWSSNLGHKIPGESNKSISLLILIQDRLLVKPGLFPTPAAFLPTNLLIKVLFPTLGIPIINALRLRGFRPLDFLLSFNSLLTLSLKSKTFLTFLLLARSTGTTQGQLALLYNLISHNN